MPLAERLANISLKSLAQNLDGFIARAIKNKWQAKREFTSYLARYIKKPYKSTI